MSQLSPLRTTSCPPRGLLIAAALLLPLARPSMVALQANPANVAGPAVVVGKSASSLEGLVARELCCLLARVSDSVPRLIRADQVRRAKEPWLIVVGTPQSNPLVRALLKRNLDGLGDQGFVLETIRHAGKRAVVVSGATPVAVSYGVYTLLERYGFGFYLGGDVVPPKQALQPLDLHEEHQPVFATRGSLPWYNFFNSPTAWNFEDYQYFADQMAKMKNNFIGFHAYDYEPFCAYDFEGKMLGGQPLMNSSQSCWGTSPMKVDEFAFGTKEFFDTEYFGSRAAMDYKDAPDGIRKAQALLQRAFDYAKRRGIKVCLGFEVGGDPLNPETGRHFELRLRHLLATYPMVDYVWLWQTEGMGSSGITPPDPASDFGAYMLRHRDEFSYLGSPNRVAEGCRLSYYFNLGYTILKQLAPKTGVVVSGWGGDRWLQFSDFYLGFDKTLPKDVIFSALDNIDANAAPGVSAAYGKLSPERQKWPIPWFEFDGDQWFPQAHTHAFSQLCPDAHKKGSQGLLAIHWQTRGVEEAAAYMAQFAWNPKLTFEEFYDELARKAVGDSHAGEMSQILRDLEGLGYRWTGGGGQSECCEPAGNFRWGSPPREENLEKLAAIRQRLVSLREEIKASGRLHGLERVEWLIHTVDFCVNYDRSVPKLRPGGVVDSLLTEAEALKNEDKQEESKAKAQEALDVLRGSEFGEGLKAYARKVTTRGELGVLATIDARAFFSYRQLELRAETFLGSLPPRDSSFLNPSEPPFVTVPVAPSIVEAGRPLTVQAIAVSNDPSRSLELDWRRVGAKGFRPVSVRNSGRSCFYSKLPSKSARGLEYAMVVRDGSGATSCWPKEYPQKVLTTTVIPAEPARIYLSEPPSVDARGNLLLQAVVVDGEEKGVKRVLARCRMQGAASWQTATMHPAFYNTFTARIATGGKSVECFIEAQNRLGLKSRFPAAGSQAPLVAKPDKEAPNPPGGLTASLNDEGTVSLSWQAREQIVQHGISHYVVERASDGDWQALGNVAIPEFIDSHVAVDKTYRYRVTGVDGAGSPGEPSPEATVAIITGPAPSSPKELKAGAGAGRVVLSWEKAPLRAVAYRILRATGPTSNFGTLREVPADYWGSHNVTDVQVEAGTQYSYRVAALDRTGVLCEPSAIVTATPRSNVTTPVLSLHFEGNVESVEGRKGEVHGATTYQPAVVGQGHRFGNEGWVSFEHDNRFNGSDGLTVGLWFKFESVTDMPVLVSHGRWEQTGCFLQLIGGKLRWYVGLEGGGSVYVDAGEIGPGRWYHVVATYDGLESCVYVNGALVGSTKKAGGIASFNGDVHIGQYQDIAPQYQVRGVIDEVLIANGAMRGSEVRKGYLRGLSANPSLAPPTFYARTSLKPVIDGEPAKSKPLMDFSFEKDTPNWRFRDGVCQLGVVQQGAHSGQACLKVDIGDGAAPWGSCLISDQSYDVSKYPLLDFWFKTDSPESACIMANLGGDQAMEWYSFIFGGEDQYRPVGRITQFLADGKWHHVTFDLGAALEGAVGKKDLTVHQLIFGSWKTPGPFTYWFDDLRICGRGPGE